MKLFLGVDGGQTTTRMVVADAHGAILCTATGGPSNHTEEPGGKERLRDVTQKTIQTALQKLGANSSNEFVSAGFGMTGETVIKQRLLKEIVRTPMLSVFHDSVAALEGATGGTPGVIVIAGTGSVARGRNRADRELRVGGWGHLFGDEGSGYWIGREVVRAILAEFDQTAEPTQLTPLVFGRLRVTSAYELMGCYYSGQFSRDHLAGLAAWACELAEIGDTVSKRIIESAGVELAKHAIEILGKLFSPLLDIRTEAGFERPIVSYTGGVFKCTLVRDSFQIAIRKRFPSIEIAKPMLPPVLGSLLLAYRSAGIVISRAQMESWAQHWESLNKQV